jgi:hypothetical protein
MYCLVCKLFPNVAFTTTALASEELDDWQNTFLIHTHEHSEKECHVDLPNMEARANINFKAR